MCIGHSTIRDRVDTDHPGYFISSSEQRYKLTFLDYSIDDTGAARTQFSVDFDTETAGVLTAYVNNIAIKLGLEERLYDKGEKSMMFKIETDVNNSGITLLEKLKLMFAPFEEGTDLDYSLERLDDHNCNLVFLNKIPEGKSIRIYINGFPEREYPIDGKEYRIYAGEGDDIRFVIGNRIYRIEKN